MKAEPRPPCKFLPPQLLRGLGSGLFGRPGAPERLSQRARGAGHSPGPRTRGRGWGSIFSPPQGLLLPPRQGAESSMTAGFLEAVWGPQGSSEQGPSPWRRVEGAPDGQSRDFPGGPVAETPCCQCRGRGLIPDQGTRPHAPQLRVCLMQLRILHAAAAKACHSLHK